MSKIVGTRGWTRKVKNLRIVNTVPHKYRSMIREKAINRARTRIIITGSDPTQFSPEDLEVVVREEEDNIKSSIKEKGVLALLALFGLQFFG